jgi:hypothetical protein
VNSLSSRGGKEFRFGRFSAAACGERCREAMKKDDFTNINSCKSLLFEHKLKTPWISGDGQNCLTNETSFHEMLNEKQD